jgi:hypothetical protein
MSSYTSFYRLANPDYYKEEKNKINEKQKERYRNDPEYRERQKEYARKQRERQKVIVIKAV